MTEQEWIDIFGDNLKELIESRKMSQNQFAYRCNITPAALSFYLNKKRIPGIRTIINMSYVLNVSIDDLIDFGDTID